MGNYNKYSKEELQDIIDNCDSIREVILKIGMSANGQGGYKQFHKKVKEKNLDISGLRQRTRQKLRKSTSKLKQNKLLEDILVENSFYPRCHLKRRLLNEGWLENICSICGQIPVWNSKPLSMHLDHINGINNDNRIENLRIICPHCHSQLETSCSKQTKHYCSQCGRKKHKHSSLCRQCHINKVIDNNKNIHKKFDIDKNKLKKMIFTERQSFEKIGREFGVSGNAIKKRAKKFGLI